MSSIYPHKTKSQGVRSELLGGQHVSATFWSVDRCVWNELDYCIDMCRETKGSHIQHL
jgi:hypothetical protein